jgi:hypothetical protein
LGSGLREASMIIDVTAIATAGAGPSRAIANTSEVNDPESRRERVSTGIASLTIVTSASAMTSSIGCQSEAREDSTAPATDATSNAPCMATRVLRPITPRLSAHSAKSLAVGAPRRRPPGH